MTALVPLPDIIAHQKAQLADAERLYMAAVKAGNYAATQFAAKRCNRIRTALVMHGALDSYADVDREKCREEDARESCHAPLPVYGVKP